VATYRRMRVQTAAGRLFFDLTGLIRSALGRRAGAAMLARAEARSGVILQRLFDRMTVGEVIVSEHDILDGVALSLGFR